VNSSTSRVSDSARSQAARLYEKGNAHRKQQQWAEAINAYDAAAALDPESPAATARKMLIEIMEYRCKEYYNP
jgi:outer membrane protein assembly factor BamD (BamD/ComL family)